MGEKQRQRLRGQGERAGEEAEEGEKCPRDECASIYCAECVGGSPAMEMAFPRLGP